MEPRTFLDTLHHAAGDYLLATVLEGEAPGAQLLLCGGVPLWPEHPAPCLSGRLPALRQITSSGVQELEGLRVFAERFGAAPQLVVCGGGHVGALRWCGWQGFWGCPFVRWKTGRILPAICGTPGRRKCFAPPFRRALPKFPAVRNVILWSSPARTTATWSA